MYLLNKKSRTIFYESVKCVSRKHRVFLCFIKQLPNCHRSSLHKRGSLTIPPANLVPQPRGAHSYPSHSASTQWPDGPPGRDTLTGWPSPMGSWWWWWLGGWWDTHVMWGISGCFLLPRSKPGYAASYNTPQTDSVLVLLSPDIFSASAAWACKRKIFITQRIRCRGKPTFCCKYRVEGYVVFAFLNASKKWKCHSQDRVVGCPCLSDSTQPWR